MHHNSYTVTTLRSLQNHIKNAKLTGQLIQVSANFWFFFISLFVFHLGRYQAKANMETKMKIPQETSIYMRYLNQHGGMKISHIAKQDTQFAERSIYSIAKRRWTKN